MSRTPDLLEEIQTLIGVLATAQAHLGNNKMPDLMNFDQRIRTLCQNIELASDEAKTEIQPPLHTLLTAINKMGDNLKLWKERQNG